MPIFNLKSNYSQFIAFTLLKFNLNPKYLINWDKIYFQQIITKSWANTNQIEMKLNLTQFWDEIQSMTILIIKLNENSRKWYKNKVAVTGSNQWKVIIIFRKFQWNISLISKPSNQWKVIIKSAIFNHFLNKIELKFRENQLNSWSIPE